MGKLIIFYDNVSNSPRQIKKPESLLCKSEEGANEILSKRKNILTATYKWGKNKEQQKQLI